MNSSVNKYKDVNEYIGSFPKEIQKILMAVRAIVRKSAPRAEEGIAYGMPAYKFNGKPLAYFAVFPKHLGFYATPNAHTKFKKELVKYKQGKGSVQFPIDKPIPLALIEKMVKFNLNVLTKKV